MFTRRWSPTRVFVLSTGRCGSTTFIRACDHLTNYTSGHETRAARVGDARFDYPERHIESDNRLSWMLGDLGRRFDPEQTLYVHLTRDREEVAQSFLKRFDSPYRAGIITAFSHAIVMHPKDWPAGKQIDLCRFYVDVVTNNIETFLEHQPHTLDVRLETADVDFPRFLSTIGAEGDLEAAQGEWGVRHNAS